MNQITYYYSIFSQKELLENQCIEEILREKNTYYLNQKIQRDFWLLISPKFIYNLDTHKKIKNSQFYRQKFKLIYPQHLNEFGFYSAIVSSNKEFINWINLRMGYCENIDNNYEERNNKMYLSDGVTGTKTIDKSTRNNLLESYPNYLHPDILISRNNKFLQLYYKNFNRNLNKI